MNVSAGPPVEPLHDQQEKGSLASGAVAHRSTPGTIVGVGWIDRVGLMAAYSFRKRKRADARLGGLAGMLATVRGTFVVVAAVHVSRSLSSSARWRSRPPCAASCVPSASSLSEAEGQPALTGYGHTSLADLALERFRKLS
jgi:hypothetical protein